MQLIGHVTWDGMNADQLRALPGYRFAGTWDTDALIRNDEGFLVHAHPGWTVSAWDGIPGRDSPAVLASAPDAWAVIAELARAAGLEAS